MSRAVIGMMIQFEGISPRSVSLEVDVVEPKWCLVGSHGPTTVLTRISCLLTYVFLEYF